MRTKMITMVTVIALVLALYAPAGAAAADTVALKVIYPEGPVAANESFTVTVEILDNPGLNVLEFILNFDKTQMACTAAKGGEALDKMMFATNPEHEDGVKVAGAGLSTNRAKGEALIAYFTAQTDIADPSFTLSEVLAEKDGAEPYGYTVSQETYKLSPDEPIEEPDVTGDDGSDVGSGEYDVDWDAIKEFEDNQPRTPSQPELEISFTDISGHWGESWILEAAKKGLFKGGTDGKFSPDDKISRAQYVTVLYRMAGSPAVTAQTPFTDIGGQIQEFQTAIAWAYEKGYVNGKSDTKFDPTGNLTRQEAMKILYYYAGGPSLEGVDTGAYDAKYVDSGEIASWAKTPVYWGVFNELISGTGGNHLSPQATATRAELAKILVNYLNRFSN